jgi:large subunit ribosomal protein L17
MLFNNLVTSLLTYGRIETTEAKAKMMRRFAEETISLSTTVADLLAKGDKATPAEKAKILHARRQARLTVKTRDALQRLFSEIGPHFASRKAGYTRILNTSTILEFSTGFFNSVESGPQEDDTALRGIQRSTYPQLARLGQFAPLHNPLGLIPQALWGNIPTADRNASNGSADAGGPAQVQYDGRWPIYGNDLAINAAVNLTHTRGRHTYKMGLMREDELFGQARSGIFGGEFNFADDAQHPTRTGYAYANALLGRCNELTQQACLQLVSQCLSLAARRCQALPREDAG